jgi:PPOX class probable F420-dependent enzyme
MNAMYPACAAPALRLNAFSARFRGPADTLGAMTEAVRLPGELRALIESGPMAHLSTMNADGSPQVTVIWIGLDGDDIVSGHMNRWAKLRNIERDPRVVLSFDAPREPGVFLNPYAMLRAQAAIEPSEQAWDLLNRLTKVYVSPDAEFPAAKGPGYIIRYRVERIGGVGPWVPASH